MPTDTFFRLPKQKRETLLEAIRTEFIRVPFAEISINRIIQDAGIPRGSFYQYFRDKEDLLDYLLKQCHEKIFHALVQLMKDNNGDLLLTALATYDRIEHCGGTKDHTLLQQLLANLRLRDQRFSDYLRSLSEEAFAPFQQQLKTAGTREELELAVDLMESAVCSAIAERFSTDASPSDIRERLKKKLRLILRGFSEIKEYNDAC